MPDDPETGRRRVHLVGVAPWRQAVDFYYNPDDDLDLDDLGFTFPARWAAGDLFVIVTTDSPASAVVVVEETHHDSTGPDSYDQYLGPFDDGLSVRAVERRLGTPLPSAPATLDTASSERLIAAISAEEKSPTPWRELDERGCVAHSEPVEPYSRCACCGKWADEEPVLVHHLLVDIQELEFFGYGPIVVCLTCHDLLHRPLAPSSDDLMFGFRPLCPRCSAIRTCQVDRGFPAGPPGPGTLLAGCDRYDPVTFEYRCGSCEYEWTDDDGSYQPLPTDLDDDVVARARTAAIPDNVYRPYSRKGEPGRVVIGRYAPRGPSPHAAAWGDAVYHEFVGQDGRIYLVDPTTLRSAEPHTWETLHPRPDES
ncbi:hypothetical protein QEN35_16815 [Gordonia alkanivorans]|uniref:Uncharacterized protein n=1 Tax=Gordonia alkanivorans CGMCC 6845 TaxID=1423140 RepID=W9DEN9_9ACTN|nr:hypothetical protein [Gordonia alkanivorans]AZZ79702.1 hypothetical protein C5O27_00120 [Gordonia alkanivorans]ETA04871.1 hypothetical protein V525_22525 [Gordonia alkanivorans CGMCC 6845]MDH3026041.1 hypothetical protein [Gordonia alkanivorans]MDH3051286.1 hypothetical protein [Gordonia alkanivorans]